MHDEHSTDASAGQSCHVTLDVHGTYHFAELETEAEGHRGGFQLPSVDHEGRIGPMSENADPCGSGSRLLQELQRFRNVVGSERRDAGHIPAWTCQSRRTVKVESRHLIRLPAGCKGIYRVDRRYPRD